METGIKWIDDFIKREEIRAENKDFLKIYNLDVINNEIFSRLDDYKNKIYLLIDELEEIKKEITTQKRRITRQTNEQNKEKAYLDALFERINKIEAKILKKNIFKDKK